MASDSGYQALLGAAWEWIKQDADLWVRTMGNLKSALALYDLESENALKLALRFSAFSILIAIAVDYPARVLFLQNGLSVSQNVADFILYYLVAFSAAISARVMSTIVRARRSMRVCLVMSLFATVYFPLNNILDYVILANRAMYTAFKFPDLNAVYNGLRNGRPMGLYSQFDIAQILAAAIVSSSVGLFVFTRLVSATRYAFRIGLLRSIIVVIGTAFLVVCIQLSLMRPIFEALTKAEFGS